MQLCKFFVIIVFDLCHHDVMDPWRSFANHLIDIDIYIGLSGGNILLLLTWICNALFYKHSSPKTLTLSTYCNFEITAFHQCRVDAVDWLYQDLLLLELDQWESNLLALAVLEEENMARTALQGKEIYGLHKIVKS